MTTVTTIAESVKNAELALGPHSESPRLDAELLLATLLGLPRAALIARGNEPLALHASAYAELIAQRAHGVPIALATDCNPGTSPLTSLLLTMHLAATLFRMTVEECLAGVTREAARALGLLGEAGTLEAGKRCDLAIWDIETPAELVYRMGFNPLRARVWSGR